VGHTAIHVDHPEMRLLGPSTVAPTSNYWQHKNSTCTCILYCALHVLLNSCIGLVATKCLNKMKIKYMPGV